MHFLEQARLENQPTEILYQLADKLKARRTKLYPEEKMYDAESSELGMEDEMDTDRKDKSEFNLDLESNNKMKNVASSQVLT